jgi:nucleotide-binding universal stress UspA family protein
MQQVVVAYDFSESADVALERALEIACRAPHHVLHFVVAVEQMDHRKTDQVQDTLSQRIAELLAVRAPEAEVHFFVHVRIGEPVDEILGLAEDVGADLILIGSHGRRGLRRLLLGSTSEAVVRGARCPVVIARPKSYREVTLEKIVEAPPDDHVRYVKPHRYTYSIERQILTRPPEWPLN